MFLILGLGALSAGCLSESPSTSLHDAPAVVRPLEGPTGSGSGNGLEPIQFLAARADLLEAFGGAAETSPGSGRPSTAVETLLANSYGQRTFKYAASCAFPQGAAVEYEDERYEGNGIIHGASLWLDDSIMGDSNALNGLFTCITARLNPAGVKVPVLLLGPYVEVDGITQTSDYPFIEMVISTVYDRYSEPPLTINVWPQEELSKLCGDQVEGSLGTRFCDNAPVGCGFVLRKDFAKACEGTPGAWVCEGHPAIETRLKQVDVGEMYPECTR
jgi:hypothetical protein